MASGETGSEVGDASNNSPVNPPSDTTTDDGSRDAKDEAGSRSNSVGSNAVDGVAFSRASAATGDPDTISQSGENQEDHILFHGVVYLGALSVRSPRNEPEIVQCMSTMNDAYTRNNENATAIKVDLLVPRVPQGTIVLFTPQSDEEISKYPIFRVIFCARGAKPTDRTDPLSLCFAFTFGMGSDVEAVFLCHAFRCVSADQVNRIIACFASAFRRPTISQLPQGESVFVFDVSVEIREEDGKGSTTYCPKEARDCFKLRANLVKNLIIHILQVSPENPHLSLEKCNCVLLAAGKNVNRSDFAVLPIQSWDNNGKQFSVTCSWDPRDQKFLLLNTETPGEHRSHMTIVVGVAIAGVTQPVTFPLHCKARVFPQTEKFWMPGRRSFQETYFLRLLWKSIESVQGSSQKGYYSILTLESQSKREGKEQDIASILDDSSPSEDEGDDGGDVDEEPLTSGFGQVSKECTEEDLRLWAEVLGVWRQNLSIRPKNLAQLIRRRGIPQSLRCEVWQLLTESVYCDQLLEEYKTLSFQESIWEAEISKDITRTFPAHEYFKSKGSEGQDQLFRVVKAYAIRDSESGYCQNISFIVAALLLHMPEEMAFCILVKIMENYGIRDLIRNDFDGLRLCFHQLQCLLAEKIPDLFYHFRDNGVEMHMFASQWFLTVFTAKFSLVCVFRILDLFLCDGRNVLFQVALGLLKISRQDLLQLDFEGILKYFRVTMPKRYKTEDTVSLLINHAVHERINSKKMAQYEAEYESKREESNVDAVLERLKRQSREQMTNILRLERENDQLAYELINGKIQLRKELDDAEMQVDLQQKEIFRLTASLSDSIEETKRTRDEAALVKELCRKMEAENQTQARSIEEYKAINSRLADSLEKESAKMEKVLSEVCDNCRSSIYDRVDAPPVKSQLPEEERIKHLELELARTKLALVEKECYTQELLHQLATLMQTSAQNDGVKTSGSWLSKTLNTIRSQTGNATGVPKDGEAAGRVRSNSIQSVSRTEASL